MSGRNEQGEMVAIVSGSVPAASLGLLYDGVNGKLFSQSIWEQSYINQHLRAPVRAFRNKVDLITDEDMSKKSTFFDASLSIQLSAMAGLVKFEGAAKVLNDQKTNSSQASLTFLWKKKTVFESIDSSIYNDKSKILKDVLTAAQRDGATHFVSGIQYGGECSITLKSSCADSKNVTELQGSLKVELSKMIPNIDASGTGDVSYVNLSEEVMRRFEVQYSGNVEFTKDPIDFSSAVQACQNVERAFKRACRIPVSDDDAVQWKALSSESEVQSREEQSSDAVQSKEEQQLEATDEVKARVLGADAPAEAELLKGFPLMVTLTPIKGYVDTVQTNIMYAISEALLREACGMLGYLDQLRVKVQCELENSKSPTVLSGAFPRFEREYETYLGLLDRFRKFMRSRVQQLIPTVRSGGESEQGLARLIADYDKSAFAPIASKQWLDHEALVYTSEVAAVQDICPVPTQDPTGTGKDPTSKDPTSTAVPALAPVTFIRGTEDLRAAASASGERIVLMFVPNSVSDSIAPVKTYMENVEAAEKAREEGARNQTDEAAQPDKVDRLLEKAKIELDEANAKLTEAEAEVERLQIELEAEDTTAAKKKAIERKLNEANLSLQDADRTYQAALKKRTALSNLGVDATVAVPPVTGATSTVTVTMPTYLGSDFSAVTRTLAAEDTVFETLTHFKNLRSAKSSTPLQFYFLDCASFATGSLLSTADGARLPGFNCGVPKSTMLFKFTPDHKPVENFKFVPAPPAKTVTVPTLESSQASYITISPGGPSPSLKEPWIVGASYLSVPLEGDHPLLYNQDDGSGRQRWFFRPVNPADLAQAERENGTTVYNIVVEGGVVEGRRFLSSSPDGQIVHIYSHDDRSGRQRWVVKPIPGSPGFVNVIIHGGVSDNRRFLSVPDSGNKVDLWGEDDTSGRQRWKISPAK